MAETVANLASLLKLGANLPLQPPRFAKVTAVSGDTVTVSLGSGTADAVRCCACAVDDVVLLETMPSGTLAAVATKGAQGGGGGVESVTIGIVNGATFTNSGTASNVVLDLSVNAPYTLETSGIWTVKKWADGTAECWGDITSTVASWSGWGNQYYSQPYISASYPAGLFIAKPVETAAAGNGAADAFMAARQGTGDATTTRTYFLVRPGTGATGGTTTVSIHAFGRWQ